MLRFNGIIIPGFHGEAVAASPEVPVSSKYPWGLRGNVLIIGKQAKRNISCQIWLNHPTWTSASSYYTGLKQLEDLVGQRGDLQLEPDTSYGVWNVPATQAFANCFFSGFECLEFNGQAVSSPVQDEAACLYSNSTDPAVRSNKSWAQFLRLNWIQTIVGRTVV